MRYKCDCCKKVYPDYMLAVLETNIKCCEECYDEVIRFIRETHIKRQLGLRS